MRLTILGAGAWGTALALSWVTRHRLTLWTMDAGHAAAMRGDLENRRFLPGFNLPPAIDIETDLRSALRDAELAVIATP